LEKIFFAFFLVFFASFAQLLRLLRPVWVFKTSSNRRFIRTGFAFVVHPSHFDFIARFAAFEGELGEWVFRHGGPPLGAEDRFASVFGFDGLDEPSGHEFAVGSAALARLHFVAHEHTHRRFVALDLGTDSHRISHFNSPSINHRSRQG
jgi:hypothetical protein